MSEGKITHRGIVPSLALQSYGRHERRVLRRQVDEPHAINTPISVVAGE
jgi:hypothetical protein